MRIEWYCTCMRVNWTFLVVSWLLVATTVYLQSRHFSGLNFLLDLPWSSFLTEAADIRRPRGAVDSGALLAGWLALNAAWTLLSVGLTLINRRERHAQHPKKTMERIAPAVPPGTETDITPALVPITVEAKAEAEVAAEPAVDDPAPPLANSADLPEDVVAAPAPIAFADALSEAVEQTDLQDRSAAADTEVLAESFDADNGNWQDEQPSSLDAVEPHAVEPHGEGADEASQPLDGRLDDLSVAQEPEARADVDPPPRSLEALAERLATAPGLSPEAREELRRLQSALEKLGRV